MAGEEEVGECGCKLVRTETGMEMQDCPKHGATDDLLEIVQELPQWERHGEYVMTPSSLWKDTDKTWAQHIAEVLKKAGVA